MATRESESAHARRAAVATPIPAPMPDQLSERDRKALQEGFVVVLDAPAEGMATVYSESGENEYTVDVESGSCTCPDMEWRAPAGGCKHVRRAQMLSGHREVPEWADTEALFPPFAAKLPDQ